MALEMHLFSPKSIRSRCLPIFPPNPRPYTTTIHLLTTSPPKRTLQISNSRSKNNRFTDVGLAAELAAEVEKINAQTVQKEEALKKGRELLFKELCNYMDLEADEFKKKWRKMNEDDKWVLIKGFVSEWGTNFHPLSAKSVKSLIDEYLVKDIHVEEDGSSSAAMLFPTLKKFMGFSQNNKG